MRRYLEVRSSLAVGEPIVDDGIKYRVRDRIAPGEYIVAEAGPHWRTAPTRELHVGGAWYDGRAGVWRPMSVEVDR